MATESNIPQLVINKMTEEQYEASAKNPNELYLTPETPASTTSFGPVKVDGETITSNDGVISATIKVTLYSDGNAIYSDPEMTTVMTYEQIKTLVDDARKIVVIDNSNYELRYQYENAQGEENAIWFNANTMLNDKPYLYRIIINSSEQVLADEKELVEAETGKGLSENDYTDADKALVDGAEQVSNKTTTISSASTDTEYPSAKAVYTVVGNIETILTAINEGEG